MRARSSWKRGSARSESSRGSSLRDYWLAGNAYLSQRNPNQWFWTNNNAAYSLSGWTALVEAGGTAASFVNPATAPDIEGYQASIGNVARSRLVWCEHYTAAAVIAYLRAQLGLAPL